MPSPSIVTNKELSQKLFMDQLDRLRSITLGRMTFYSSYPEYNHLLTQFFTQLLGFKEIDNPTKADILLFPGGEDIHPRFYKQEYFKYTKFHNPKNPNPKIRHEPFNNKRDTKEWFLFKSASPSQYKIGICRGAQFLNVMNGGSLWQDVDGHVNNHHILDLENNTFFLTTSTHHQQMIPNFVDWNFTPLALACSSSGELTSLCSHKLDAKQLIQGPRNGQTPLSIAFNRTLSQMDAWDETKSTYLDYEALWYAESNSFCYQPHPEYQRMGTEISRAYFVDLLIQILSDTDPFTTPNKPPTLFMLDTKSAYAAPSTQKLSIQ